MRNIEIDFDVHKMIETNRKGFEETANTVLRRLLGLPEQSGTSIPETINNGRSWRKGSVELPSGTKLRMEHNGTVYLSEIVDGKWMDSNGTVHRSASGAANALVREKGNTTLNGKIYWHIKLPQSEKWTRYDDFEKKCLNDLNIDVNI